MGRSKGLDANTAVSFDIGGDRGDQLGSADGFLGVEPSLVISFFSILNLLENLINCPCLQCLFSVGLIRKLFRLLDAYTASQEVRNEVTHSRHSETGRG
jgi:hypothetical protein